MTTRNQSRDYSRAHRQLSVALHCGAHRRGPSEHPAIAATLKTALRTASRN